MDNFSQRNLNIAIIGAGIAGLTAAIALSQHPLINIVVYEKTNELREIGASIALGPNGLRTLQRLGLGDGIFEDGGIGFRGVAEGRSAGMIYRHWETNEIIGKDEFVDVKDRRHMTARFLRAHLQEALLEHVPSKAVIKLGRKLIGIGTEEKDVVLNFEDGSVAVADIVLGADGLHSGVRQYLIPDHKLEWSGSTAFRAVFDASLVEGIPGLPEDSAHWWGPETTFFASKLGRNMYTVVGGVYGDPEDPDAKYRQVEWDQRGGVDHFRKIYAHWNPVVRRLTEVTPSIRYYPNFSCGIPLDSWVFDGRVTLIGDAAHAHGGAFATGGSLAIDDAYAFYLALDSIFPSTATRKASKEEITKALLLYEATRKPHAERLLGIVKKSNTAKLERYRKGSVETDKEMRDRAGKGADMGWLHEYDVVSAFEKSKETLQQTKGEIRMRI